MPKLRSRHARVVAALLFAALGRIASAAELGDATVASYIGQPLVADIELTALTDPATAVVVRNASMDVYRGANIAVSPALAGLGLSVVRRDGRQFLHVTTVRPVEAGYLHLFLELTEGGKQNVRSTTLWLTADPAPPPPKPVVPPIAAVARPVPSTPPPAPPPARQAPLAQDEAPVRKPVREITLGKAPPSCAQTEEQVKACAATEYKNGLLSAQVVELEEKVRQLQLLVDAKAASGAAASATASMSADAAAVAKAAAAASAPAKADQHEGDKPSADKHEADKHAADSGGFPWLLVGGIVAGLLVLAGAALWFIKRRKGMPAAGGAPGGSFLSRIKGKFSRKVDPAPVAPSAPPEQDSA